MIPDPATTPIRIPRQIAFGLSVGLLYGSLLAAHVVYGLFFALALTSAVRGAGLYAAAWLKAHALSQGQGKAITQSEVLAR
jgi:hypothetical protein